MPDHAKMSRLQREHFGYMMDVLEQLEWDLHLPVISQRRIPAEWHEIAQTRHPRRKKKVTLWVEEDVIRFFRKMGTGYTTRMNDVLVSYMHARLAGLIEGRDTRVEFRPVAEMPPRPEFDAFDEALAARVKARQDAADDG